MYNVIVFSLEKRRPNEIFSDRHRLCGMDDSVPADRSEIMYALINGVSYPVEVHSIDKSRWLAKVTCTNDEQPFSRWTHGGWADYSSGYVTISNLRDADGNVVPLERQRLESKNN